MLKLSLALLLLNLLAGDPRNCGHARGQRITVIGIAEDDKDLAAVTVQGHGHYLLEGMDDGWPAGYEGKLVQVTGELVLEAHQKQSTDSVQVQERVGTWQVLKHPKWKLVKAR